MAYTAVFTRRGVLAFLLCLPIAWSVTACDPSNSEMPATSAVQSTYPQKPLPPRPTLRPATPDADHIYKAVSGQYSLNGIFLEKLEWDGLSVAICEDFLATGEGLLLPAQATGLDPKKQQSLADWGRAGAGLLGCANGVDMASEAGFTWSLLLGNLLHDRDIDDVKRVGEFNRALIKWGGENYVDINAELLDVPGTSAGRFGYCSDGETTQSKGKRGACSSHDGLRR